ncbi:MAG: phosphodiester glycosidase family protein [Candidatus Sumerlaeaceae bacterium]|nr:phosphodiester glycosidase family protein [Candidatus Sumerlaeaceae bacterium]
MDLLTGIPELSPDPILSLKAVTIESPDVTRDQLDAFLAFLREIAGPVDKTVDAETAENWDLPVEWAREKVTLFPLYIESLRVVPAEQLGDTEWAVRARLERPGCWVVSDTVLRDGDGHFSKRRDKWEELLRSPMRRELSGGLACNVVEVAAEKLTSGELDVRPLVLHALAKDGAACDRGNPKSQAAIANAFWQTFWATGAHRSERGVTFPVAFLPVDRANAGEFRGPFRERYVSLRRRLFGRTAIVGYHIEILTKARALYFDRGRNLFRVAHSFDPKAHHAAESDLALAVAELNRTGFVDAYTRENAQMFAAWRVHEEQGTSGAPTSDPYRIPTFESLRINPAETAGGCIRIHRVVPFAGCAYLSEVVQDTERLKAAGKIQDFDGDIVCATNSTFFLNFPEEYSTLHSAMNDPVSLLVENGRTHQIKTMRRATFHLTNDGSAAITTRAGIKLNSEVLVFEGESSSATSFLRAGKPYRDNTFGPLFFGSVVVGDSIVETFEEMATEIPSNGWLIGDSEAFGGTIDPRHAAEAQVRSDDGRRDLELRHAFAVGPLLVADGAIVPLGESREEFQSLIIRETPSAEETSNLARTELPAAMMNCEKRGVAPTRFPYDWNDTRAPRTAIGVKADGSVVLVVVDGRANLPHSVGVTLAELAQLMLNLGCQSAMNMDGGGSSVMFLPHPRAKALKLRDDLRDGVVNLPSDLGGIERLLPVPLVICRKK